MADIVAQIAELAAEGLTEYAIHKRLGIKRHQARKGIDAYLKGKASQALTIIPPQAAVLELYDAACRALAEASAIEDVMPLLDQIEHVKLHAKKVRDRLLMADALAFQQKAERKLGQVIVAAREISGHFVQGHRSSKSSDEELLPRATLAEVGVDRKLSSRAQKLAQQDDATFKESVESLRERVIAGAAKVVDREAAQAEKGDRRAEREHILGAKQQALPQQKFGVIVADPEWRFEPWSRKTGMDRAADNHYPTSCTEVIASRDVKSIAADDCVLFLWATVPMLPHALLVMEAWGFDYRSHCIWSKRRDGNEFGMAVSAPAVGTGYWFRNCHELLLVGVKGKIPAPAPGTQEISIIEGHIREHSRKPDYFLEIIERLFPTLPKIELNRRGPARPGWIAWGNEAEQLEAAE